MAENNFSLSDLVAAMGGGMNGLGGNNWLVILIVIFMLSGGGWGFNRGNGDYGQYATAASQPYHFPSVCSADCRLRTRS